VNALDPQLAGATVSTTEATNAKMLTQVVGKLLEALQGGSADLITAIEAVTAAVGALPIYEQGTWTPALTFATPGNLVVAYSVQAGEYVRLGNLVIAQFLITTSTFTHTTASGDARITGLPFTNGALTRRGPLSWQRITKAGYTDIAAALTAGANILILQASGSTLDVSQVTAADMPTSGVVILAGTIVYRTA
jgi:hypothetical protein